MSIKKHTLLSAIALLICAPSLSFAGSVFFEFNGNDDVEGWTSANITGLTTQTTVFGGTEGVLTSSDVTSIGPSLFYAEPEPNLDPGSGNTWDSIEVRFRQLSANTPGTPVDLVTTGPMAARILFQGVDYVATSLTEGSGTLTSNQVPGQPISYTLLNDEGVAGDKWMKLIFDISTATTSSNRVIRQFRLDPFADNADKNFEVDYARFLIPEPASYALLSGLLALTWIMIRRRR